MSAGANDCVIFMLHMYDSWEVSTRTVERLFTKEPRVTVDVFVCVCICLHVFLHCKYFEFIAWYKSCVEVTGGACRVEEDFLLLDYSEEAQKMAW